MQITLLVTLFRTLVLHFISCRKKRIQAMMEAYRFSLLAQCNTVVKTLYQQSTNHFWKGFTCQFYGLVLLKGFYCSGTRVKKCLDLRFGSSFWKGGDGSRVGISECNVVVKLTWISSSSLMSNLQSLIYFNIIRDIFPHFVHVSLCIDQNWKSKGWAPLGTVLPVSTCLFTISR